MDKIPAVCIKGDIIGSRVNRKERELKGIVDHLNHEFNGHLITEFTIRAGDEFFGIVNRFRSGYEVFKEIYYLSQKFRVPLYVGVGFGDIFNESLDDPERVNGEAIWNASDALEFLRTTNFRGKDAIHSLDESFKYDMLIGNDRENSSIINYYIYFIFDKIRKRTEKQTKAIRMLEKNPDLTYGELGEYLNYREEHRIVNVSKLLARAEYQLVKHAEEELLKLIHIVYQFGKKGT